MSEDIVKYNVAGKCVDCWWDCKMKLRAPCSNFVSKDDPTVSGTPTEKRTEAIPAQQASNEANCTNCSKAKVWVPYSTKLMAEGGAEGNQKHYAQHNIQPIDLIVDWDLGFEQGNVIKYVCRYPFKNGLQDLKKAMLNLQILIDKEEKRLAEGKGFKDEAARLHQKWLQEGCK